MKDLKFTSTHEWAKSTESLVTIGITDHAQQLLGDMVFVEMPEIGQMFKAGDEMGVVESVKAASDFYAPMSGEVIEVNEAVVSDPSIVNRDPYEAGWLVKLKPSQLQELEGLLSADAYQKVVAEE